MTLYQYENSADEKGQSALLSLGPVRAFDSIDWNYLWAMLLYL